MTCKVQFFGIKLLLWICYSKICRRCNLTWQETVCNWLKTSISRVIVAIVQVQGKLVDVVQGVDGGSHASHLAPALSSTLLSTGAHTCDTGHWDRARSWRWCGGWHLSSWVRSSACGTWHQRVIYVTIMHMHLCLV